MSQSLDLEQLCADWLVVKATEQRANRARVAIEAQIVELTGKRDEGAKTVTADGYKIVVTGKVNRKMDWAKWEEIKVQIAPELHPVKFKPELDEKGVKWLAEHQPDVYKLLPITVTPAKSAIDIKPMEIAA